MVHLMKQAIKQNMTANPPTRHPIPAFALDVCNHLPVRAHTLSQPVGISLSISWMPTITRIELIKTKKQNAPTIMMHTPFCTPER